MVGPDISAVSFNDMEPQQCVWLDMMCEDGSDHTVRVAPIDGQIAGFCSHSL